MTGHKVQAEDSGRCVCELLQQLGETANHIGFHYTVCAVRLAMEEPNRLLMVTKWLYPDIAKELGTTAASVERGIRCTVELVWKKDPDRLCRALNVPISERPTASKFIAMLCVYCSREG